MSVVTTPANHRFDMNRMSGKFNTALGVPPQGFCRAQHEEQQWRPTPSAE
jgi:hypothetical protein